MPPNTWHLYLLKPLIAMQFDPDNQIIQLCAHGMELEGEGRPDEASAAFQQAWEQAANDFDKFIAAHYIARHQQTVADKLKWDETALQLALNIKEDGIEGTFPSLYLNIAKCYEDLNDFAKAKENYQNALSYTDFLLDDGYGNMIKAGIEKGIGRVS
jgi:tetratricopeptide (TPR) repeat protein